MILLTGAAGFIGFHVAKKLLSRGLAVAGIDSLNDYYDPALKRARIAQIEDHKAFTFHQADIADEQAIRGIMDKYPDITAIVHLAAQAGVRYSLENPHAYAHSNLNGQLVMLEAARHAKKLQHFVYASSSSVYGNATHAPFPETARTNQPVSLYAATKRAGELLTHSYTHLYGFPATGLRFFTVYGPWGRPDMAYFSFTKAILEDKPIKVFNNGDLRRDFTYIDDVVYGVVHAVEKPPQTGGAHVIGDAPHRILNLGNHRPVMLGDFITTIEKALGKKAIRENAPMAPGDVYETCADISAARDVLGFEPKTTLDTGIPKFVEWYKGYYKA